MLERLKQLNQEYNLKLFYSTVLAAIDDRTPAFSFELLTRLAPFIRTFHGKFVNYYGLAKAPAFDAQKYQSRIAELYSELCRHLMESSPDQTIVWLLDQTTTQQKKLFPARPVPDSFQDIMRSLSVLVEWFKAIPVSEMETYHRVFDHIKAILSPTLDHDFEAAGKDLLNLLAEFNARKEGAVSPKFARLVDRIKHTNQQARSLLMSNNTFVSLLQQIAEINKALKTLRKEDCETILSETELSQFWNGLKEHGYSGGDNYLYGDFPSVRTALSGWLNQAFPMQAEALLAVLERTFFGPQLPDLDKENAPDAVQLYAINVISAIGLRTKEAIRLVLGFHSRYVDKMVRDGAYQALKQNAAQVQAYFFQSLGELADYDQMVLLADKHDTIFSQIRATDLIQAYGEKFNEALQELDAITAPDGIMLGNFIRSAYLKPAGESGASGTMTASDRLLAHFRQINARLSAFKAFIENKSHSGFSSLVRMWGLNYIVSWSLTDFIAEERLFSFIILAAKEFPISRITTITKVIPLQEIVTLLAREPDAKELIQKLMTFLLNSKISFDYRLFSSLFQVVAQRQQQLQGGIQIRDGFSEQRGYSQDRQSLQNSRDSMPLQDPHIFHPIVIFLITILHMKNINIPKDAFVETDISLYLNSLAERQKNPELGYQMFLAHQLIGSIPYIKDFSSQHETVIRKTIADLDESYKRQNILFHYHRIKIHRAPSKLDLDFCLEILEGLTEKPLATVLENLMRLMKGIGDEAIPELKAYFEHYRYRLQTLGKHLRAFKSHFPAQSWQEIADDTEFTRVVRDLPGIDADSTKDIIALVKLVNALSNYWTQRINLRALESYFSDEEIKLFGPSDTVEKLKMVRSKRTKLQSLIYRFDSLLEPYQHIFLKRHVIQGDWNFDFFGFWPYYKETKFETYNADRKLAHLERLLLEKRVQELAYDNSVFERLNEQSLRQLRLSIECLTSSMVHLMDEGLAPSKYFLDTVELLRKDQLTLSQLHDVLGILLYRELSHIDAFVANTFGHFPAQITKALGRENLDFGLDQLSVSHEELLFPLVQETVLGNIMARLHPIQLLENQLTALLQTTARLKAIDPSRKLFEDSERPPRRLSPVYYGYKSYALQTLAADGFNVPALETIPVTFFEQHPEFVENPCHTDFKTVMIQRLLRLEQKTGKWFRFIESKLTEQQRIMIDEARHQTGLRPNASEPLLISARSGSYRSMPGILGTVLSIGFEDILKPEYRYPVGRLELNSYRMFLSTFGNVVFGINEIHFSKIVEASKKQLETNSKRTIKWEDLSDDQIKQIIVAFKSLIATHHRNLPPAKRVNLDWDDPLALVAIASVGVWNSWDSPAAIKLRKFLDISPDWKTPVTLMEMKQADKNTQSFSAILFSGDPQGKIDRPHGDLLFGRPGEDIASGLASAGIPLETVENENPKLYRQIADLLEQIKINKGFVNVDVELVGEFDPANKRMELFVVQERQMPLGARSESDDFRLTPTDQKPVATGKGVNGGVQYGVFLDGIGQEYYQLRNTVRRVRQKLGEKDQYHGPGIFLLMKYVTPEEALKMNIAGVDGVVTTKIGKSSHASIAAKRDGKLFVCEASVTAKTDGWYLGERKIRLGDEDQPDLFTVVGNPKSVSPYSGNIYQGILPLTQVAKKR